MAFCTNCGAKLADDAKFCTECGAKVEPLPSEPVTEPVTTPASASGAAPANDYTRPVSDYTYTPPSNGYIYTPTGQNTASSGSYTPEIPRNTYSYDPAAASTGGTQPPRPPHDIPGGSQPQKRKMSFLPFLLIAIGVAALVFLLISFFGSDSDADDPTYGVYVASYGTFAGSRIEIEDMWPNGFTIELLSKNKCRVAVNGETETCRYKLENNGEIEIDLRGDEDLEGRLVDNRLTLEDVMDSGVDLVFYKEGTVAPAVEVPAVTEAPAIDTPVATAAPIDSDYAWWDGDWYGWWVIYEGGGDYADLESYCYDACATISVFGDTGLVDLWDEDCAEGMNIGYIDVAFEPGTTDKGRMVSVSGDFYDDEIAAGDWVVDPGDSIVSRFDSMILIDGMYYEDDNSSNWIHYYVFLRPWGMSWEDVRSDSCYDMPYDNMLPLGYDSWYVPHMNDAMPSYIDLDRGEAA